MKDLYNENNKRINERNRKQHQKVRICHVRIGRTNIIKMSIVPKAIDRLNEIMIKISIIFSHIWTIVRMQIEPEETPNS